MKECIPEPMEQEEKKPEVKTEMKEEEDRPNTPATQSSPAPGQSKRKSKQKNCFGHRIQISGRTGISSQKLNFLQCSQFAFMNSSLGGSWT